MARAGDFGPAGIAMRICRDAAGSIGTRRKPSLDRHPGSESEHRHVRQHPRRSWPLQSQLLSRPSPGPLQLEPGCATLSGTGIPAERAVTVTSRLGCHSPEFWPSSFAVRLAAAQTGSHALLEPGRPEAGAASNAQGKDGE